MYQIFHQVLQDWICNDAVIDLNIHKNLEDVESMKKTAREFANGTSNGTIGGCIGALDGWLVKIISPSAKRDGIRNAGGFFSRKGYYAINVQAIVDKHKRVLWHSIKCRGGEHDSSAFKATSLYATLLDKKSELLKLGLYIICDSAYALRSFLLTPSTMLGMGLRKIISTSTIPQAESTWNVPLVKLIIGGVSFGDH